MTSIKQDISAMVPILSVAAISTATGVYATHRLYQEEIYVSRQSQALMEKICIEETGRRNRPWVGKPFFEAPKKDSEESND